MTVTDLSRFSDEARAVIDDSLRVALRLGHSDIRPEHLFLALLREENSVTVDALTKVCDLELGQVRRAVLKVLRWSNRATLHNDFYDYRSHGPMTAQPVPDDQADPRDQEAVRATLLASVAKVAALARAKYHI